MSSYNVGRVLRGGSYNNNANNCRVSNRNNNTPGNRNNNNGFRCVQDFSMHAAGIIPFTDRVREPREVQSSRRCPRERAEHLSVLRGRRVEPFEIRLGEHAGVVICGRALFDCVNRSGAQGSSENSS